MGLETNLQNGVLGEGGHKNYCAAALMRCLMHGCHKIGPGMRFGKEEVVRALNTSRKISCHIAHVMGAGLMSSGPKAIPIYSRNDVEQYERGMANPPKAVWKIQEFVTGEAHAAQSERRYWGGGFKGKENHMEVSVCVRGPGQTPCRKALQTTPEAKGGAQVPPSHPSGRTHVPAMAPDEGAWVPIRGHQRWPPGY
uniref:Uncharacterized protein n=1 Tax=Eutreptiella gymnastica TaxID=73025 RepID=A0A7S1N3S7_9EUGL|mmetsp:Transcript_112763/g.195768  ORF Transcript_112763/g.195768 Transcript_112763/m.195768 type:complete len:196 (+) Transcript_112763:681-1268(+)